MSLSTRPPRLSPLATAVLVATTALLAGCSHHYSADEQRRIDTFSSRYVPGQEPVMTTAPVDGYYQLYRNGHSISRFELKKGDPIGFSKSPLEYTPGNKPEYRYAVGGDHDFRIDPNDHYEWREVPYKTVKDYVPRTIY